MRAEIPRRSNTEKQKNDINLAVIAGKIDEGNTNSMCAACDEKKISGI